MGVWLYFFNATTAAWPLARERGLLFAEGSVRIHDLAGLRKLALLDASELRLSEVQNSLIHALDEETHDGARHRLPGDRRVRIRSWRHDLDDRGVQRGATLISHGDAR